MARIRTIKPEFWSHEGLSMLPESTHMLAAALLNYADDEGYFNANPGLVKAACSPLREPSVSPPESLRSLQEIGYIALGTGPDGRRYGRIMHFLDHQKISHPAKSKLASISITWDILQNPPEILQSPPESLRPDQGSGIRERGTGNGEQGVIRTISQNHETNPETSEQKQRDAKKRTPTIKQPDDVNVETWQAFTLLRKAKKAPISDVAIARMREEAVKAKISLDEAMRECCARGWQGFRAEWITEDRGGGQARANGKAPVNSYVGLAEKDYGKTRVGSFLEKYFESEEGKNA